MADETYNSKVYRKQGGDEMVIAAGGKLKIETGGQIVPNDGVQEAAIADVPTGVSADVEDNADAINAILAVYRALGLIAT